MDVTEHTIYNTTPFSNNPDPTRLSPSEGMFLNEWGQVRGYEATNFYNKDSGEQKASTPDLFKYFFTSLRFVQHCSQIIQYQEVED